MRQNKTNVARSLGEIQEQQGNADHTKMQARRDAGQVISGLACPETPSTALRS